MGTFMEFQQPEFLLALNQAMCNEQRYTILVIHDNTSLRESVRDKLKTAYQVAESGDSQHGFDLANQIQPDLIITDLMMPNLQEQSLCYQLKHQDKTSHIPIIILGGQDSLFSRVNSFYLGADDFMATPFQLVELQIRIQNLIQSRKVLQKKYSRQVELKPSPIQVQSADDLFLGRAMKAVEENIDNPMFGSKEFARMVGLSQTRLYRKLVSLTGYSANDFIRRVRLHRAADLLRQKAGNVSEIAYQVGFNSLSYFAKCFKQLHQYSPRDFVRLAGQ